MYSTKEMNKLNICIRLAHECSASHRSISLQINMINLYALLTTTSLSKRKGIDYIFI